MSNIVDLSDGMLNTLHERLTDILLRFRDYHVSQVPMYKGVLDRTDRAKYMSTLFYVNNVLTSNLAKLYMVMGCTKGEITLSQLARNLKDIEADMMRLSTEEMYHRHKPLKNFVDEAIDINTRIDCVSGGGLHYAQED